MSHAASDVSAAEREFKREKMAKYMGDDGAPRSFPLLKLLELNRRRLLFMPRLNAPATPGSFSKNWPLARGTNGKEEPAARNSFMVLRYELAAAYRFLGKGRWFSFPLVYGRQIRSVTVKEALAELDSESRGRDADAQGVLEGLNVPSKSDLDKMLKGGPLPFGGRAGARLELDKYNIELMPYLAKLKRGDFLSSDQEKALESLQMQFHRVESVVRALEIELQRREWEQQEKRNRFIDKERELLEPENPPTTSAGKKKWALQLRMTFSPDAMTDEDIMKRVGLNPKACYKWKPQWKRIKASWSTKK